ncbi:MAG: hypothetical protein M1829_002309 [Trizodia sp. TS-e1964]|nr:MAG: hypothetical protein M1829_002309 [Trizodia sp. TS-e1964]
MQFASSNAAHSALCALLLAASTVSSLAVLPEALGWPEANSASTSIEDEISSLEPASRQLESRNTEFSPFYLEKIRLEDAITVVILMIDDTTRFHISTITIKQFDPQDRAPIGQLKPWSQDEDLSFIIWAEYNAAAKKWATHSGFMPNIYEAIVDEEGTTPLGHTQYPMRIENLIRKMPVVAVKGQTGYEITKSWVEQATASIPGDAWAL